MDDSYSVPVRQRGTGVLIPPGLQEVCVQQADCEESSSGDSWTDFPVLRRGPAARSERLLVPDSCAL